MTIHSGHPFAEAEPDPVRRFRGRLASAVTLWTAGADRQRAGLTVSSVMVANGDVPHLLALVDPDSDLAEVVRATGQAVVHVLDWSHRDLAEAFAGTVPAPGGVFAQAEFEQTPSGPRLLGAETWSAVSLVEHRLLGWSLLLTCRIEQVTIGADAAPLVHRRGRYLRPMGE